jgi:Ca2+-binding EF-hand superfamily protein
LLISGSSNKDKAIAFFEIFDKDGNKTIKAREATRFAKDCFDASVEKLPNLAKGSSKLVTEGVDQYVEKLKPHREKFAEDTVNIIMKGQPELGQSQFVDVILREAPFVVTSSGIRCEVYKNYALKGN